MAPPPEYDKEPKAPDKSATKNTSEDLSISHGVLSDQYINSDSNTANQTSNNEIENVENLNELELQALLNECSTYKSPKDREGKSTLFKNLLKEAEKDDKEEAVRGARGGVVRRSVRVGSGGCAGGGARRGELAHSNSLQDVAALGALGGDAAHAHRHRRHPHQHQHQHHGSVSARTHHGGSLPSGVDTSFQTFEESPRRMGIGMGAEYVATVQCVNPSPHVERRVSISDAHDAHNAHNAHNAHEADLARPVFTSIRTMDIGSGSSGCPGRAVTTTTASNQVDTAIAFSCITTPEVVSSCNTTSSTSQAAVAADAKPRSVISSSINGLLLARPNYGSTGTTTAGTTAGSTTTATITTTGGGGGATSTEEHKKSLDENGNSVQGYSSPLSGSSQHKKPRRKKSSKNETVINLQKIDGYQGNKDVNELLRFIEADNGRGHKLGRAKHKDDSDDKSGKKRSTERRKDKENKIKRATSMEELSRTKLEDLTDKVEVAAGATTGAAGAALRKNKKERWTDGGAAPKAERRSWGDDARDAFYFEHEPDADFQTVTKKRKARRRAEECERESTCGAGAGATGARRGRDRDRERERDRTGAPVSDRSNDSNDDMDSVHSLPADATPPRNHAHPSAPVHTPHAAAAAPVPTHVSYADIARTRHNIPDLIESCNFYAESEPVGVLCADAGGGGGGVAPEEEAPQPPAAPAVPPAPGDPDGYPALETRSPPAATNVPGGNNVLRRCREPKLSPGATTMVSGSAVRRERKERDAARAHAACGVVGVGVVSAVVPAPAPDVVADRRPPVILLDSAARPCDMDGVTFGFDINEQLLGGGGCGRRPRCDLVRDAVEAGGVRARTAAGAGPGECAPPLRYIPPPTRDSADNNHLHQIVNYIGHAWEDVVKCVGGKVRYFSE